MQGKGEILSRGVERLTRLLHGFRFAGGFNGNASLGHAALKAGFAGVDIDTWRRNARCLPPRRLVLADKNLCVFFDG
ncbi:hypothetical protein DGI_3435 [Megalodesulfovibrio gigas DSM 1382 = ATCC 19364]|uniref:Uncharacterized protein n=1 Tax=Megalodesulfovibrio gigas (strain ATCC 19364 / DSM 1382 / NCIMB 9332 / VKM B-1759) TaxID=1121448 RepID=T2GEW8_MEGG1|nr:hypothetical protein DGI_3435 [Megalodesulfovibrio gigas DSM 1382 = ATCC 19364]